MRKILTVFLLLTLFISVFALSAFAEAESVGTTDQNPFAMFYSEIFKHSDKILSALAFFGSMLLAFAYRKGLLPIMRGGLSTLNSAVSSLKEETERILSESDERTAMAVEKLADAEKIISALSAKLELLETELEKTNTLQSRNSDLKVIMRFQIDMLYEVFMSSSLPAYQKDAIGEKIRDMKSLISSSEEEKDE